MATDLYPTLDDTVISSIPEEEFKNPQPKTYLSIALKNQKDQIDNSVTPNMLIRREVHEPSPGYFF